MSSPRLVLLTSVAVLAFSPELLAAPLPPEQPLPVVGTASTALSGNPAMPIRTAQTKQAPAADDQDKDDQDQDGDDQGQDPDEDDEGDEDQDQNQPKGKD